MKQNNLRGHGFFRKSKAYGLVCGVTLATALTLATTTVSADQTVVTTPNPATNLVEAQEPSSHSSIELAKEAGQQSGELVTSVTSQELTNALDTAKNAGVTINPETAPVIHTSLEAAQNDLSAQSQEVATVTAKQEANTEAIKEANNTNADIDRQNKAEANRIAQVNAQGQADVEARNRQGQADVDARNRAGRAEVDARNRAGQEAIDKVNSQLKSQADTINAKLESEYHKKLSERNDLIAENDAIRQRNISKQSEAEKLNALAMEEFNRKKSEMELKLSEEGYAKKVLSQALDLSEEENSKVSLYGDIKAYIKSASGADVFQIAHEALDGKAVTSQKQTLADMPNANTWATYGLIIPDGGKVTAKFTNLTNSTYDNSPLGSIEMTVTGHSKNGTDLVLWLSDKITNGYEIYSKVIDQSEDVTLKFFDVSGKPITFTKDYPALFGFGSLNRHDGSVEYVSNYNFEMVEINGSSIKEHSDGVYSDNDNDYKNNGSRFDNIEWDPDGSPLAYYGAAIGVVTSGDTIGFTAGNKEFFGHFTDITTKVAAPVLPMVPKLVKVNPEKELPIPPLPELPDYISPQFVTFSPETFTPEVFTPVSYKPLTPTVIPHVPVPEKESYAVSTHPVLVKQAPKNHKDVLNSDGISVDAQLVAKGDWHTWVLTNDNLKAGRDELKDYFMRDPLTSGIEIDWVASMAKSPAWARSTDEAGVTILSASPATLNSLNANRQLDVTVPVFNLVFRPLNDGGTYVNTFETVMVTAKGEYKVVSNTPVIYTPGNDPQTPRPPRVPGGETPTPNDNLIQPKKDVVDEEGQSINGKSVLPNAVLNYIAEQDFDQYKGMSASRSAILKSFLHLDDPKDEALDGKSMVINSITAANGDDVRELFEMRHVLSLETLEDKLQTLIKEAGISPVGEFYLWVAKDPEAFFKAYVQKGLDITYNLSFKIKQDFVGTITNQTYQVDFGNGYYGNVVTNEVPPLIVHKEVLDKDGQSIDGQIVKLGDKVTYKLEGWVIPAGRGYDIHEYRFVDLLQASHDKFETHKVKASVDIALPDGTVIVAGSDLMAYTETIYDAKTGLFELRFKEDFLGVIPRTSAFGADVYLTVERIASGEVVNEYTLFVNGNPVVSNKVTTNTPEPPAPQTPQTPEKPVPSNTPRLPETGEGGSLFTVLAGALSSILGLLGFGRKKQNL